MEAVELKVSGMRCQHCVESVTKALKPLVGEVKVDLKSGKVSFEGDPQKIDLNAVKTAIDEIGFEVVE
ncbi:MAG: cation transporter [Helicobacteraceae bacterium]|nr:cation transporter [Helicobacteraceae bacterium]